ncbi:MAG: LuxR C-terminal-related transcriptional regulator [Demequina sp.]|uniref:LuxR C-terminal-related transcriptional regulator n=1 Tax=Demequina sp. TaxID=2050685 RepID=UPI003A8C0C19
MPHHTETAAPEVVAPPAVPSWAVARPRLLVSVGAPLVLIEGPPACGKTIAAAQMADAAIARGLSVTWVDAHRRELPEAVAVVPGDADLLIIDRPWVSDPAAGWEALASLRARSVIIAGRAARELRERAELATDAVLVDADELALTADEVAAALELADAAHDDAVVAAVTEATAGYALAVRAIAAAAGRRAIDLADVGVATLRAVARRGAATAVEAVREAIEPEVSLTDLARLAVPREVSIRTATALVGAERAERAMTASALHGLGARIEAPLPGLRLHPAIRDVLLNAGPLDAAARSRVLDVVARETEKEGNEAGAQRARLAGDDPDALVELLFRVDPHFELVRHLRGRDGLESWSSGMLAARPSLAIARASHALAGGEGIARARQWLGIALESARRVLADDPPLARRAEALASAMVAHRWNGRFRDAASHARELLSLASETCADPTTRLMLAIGTTEAVSTLVTTGDLGEATVEAVRLHEAMGGEDMVASTVYLAAAQVLDGRVLDGRESLRQVTTMTSERGRHTPPHVLMRLTECYLAVEEGDATGAQNLLEQSARTILGSQLWPAFAEVHLLAELIRFSTEPAEGGFDRWWEQESPFSAAPAWTVRLTGLRAMAALSQGDADRARALLSRVDGLPGAPLLGPLVHARLHLAAGDADAALAEAQRAVRGHSPRVVAAAYLVGAVIRDTQGDGVGAARSTARAASILAAHGMALPLLLVSGPEREALWRHRGALTGVEAVSLERAMDAMSPLPWPRAAAATLTPSEQVTLELLARGLSQQQIARERTVSLNTVRSQLRSLYRKLGASDRHEAVLIAHSRRLLS